LPGKARCNRQSRLDRESVDFFGIYTAAPNNSFFSWRGIPFLGMPREELRNPDRLLDPELRSAQAGTDT